jgi:hypothetical protein
MYREISGNFTVREISVDSEERVLPPETWREKTP